MRTITAKSLVLVFLVLAIRSLGFCEQKPDSSHTSESVVDLSVIVRDRHSNPVIGLTRDDFIIKDAGKNVFATVRPVRLTGAHGSDSIETDGVVEVSVLVIIPPLSLEGRQYVLRAAAKYLSNPPLGFKVAIVDASGERLPFTSDALELTKFIKRLEPMELVPGSTKAYRQAYVAPSWRTDVQYLLEQESLRPGIRTAVLFADPDVFFPYFNDLSHQYGVALYIADTRGVVTAIPYGDAATQNPFGPGPSGPPMSTGSDTAYQVNMEDMALQRMAEETGGRASIKNNDLSQIFHAVEDDAKGSYELRLYINHAKSHRVTISLARPGSKLTVLPSFTTRPGSLLAKSAESKSSLSAIDPGSLRAIITPTVAFFPSYRNGLFMLAISCSVQPSGSKHLELPAAAQLSIEISSDLEGSLGVAKTMLPLKADNALIATYTSLAKLTAGSYTLTFALHDVVNGKSSESDPPLLAVRLYRFVIHPEFEQPLYPSSLMVGHLIPGSTGTIDVLGFTNRAQSVLLNNPLDIGRYHIALRPGNEFTDREDFAVVAKVYADDKLKREIRDKWLKSAVMLSMTGDIVAGPFTGNSDQAADGGLATIFEVPSRELGNRLKPGSYEIRVELKPFAKSDKTLILTAPMRIQ